jgi:hypothetical protein
MIIKRMDNIKELELISPNKIISFPKNPVKGGIPAIENNITTKEKDQTLFNWKKLDKLDKKSDVDNLE